MVKNACFLSFLRIRQSGEVLVSLCFSRAREVPFATSFSFLLWGMVVLFLPIYALRWIFFIITIYNDIFSNFLIFYGIFETNFYNMEWSHIIKIKKRQKKVFMYSFYGSGADRNIGHFAQIIQLFSLISVRFYEKMKKL